MIRVLLYSEEPVLAAGLKAILSAAEGFELLPVCNDLSTMNDRLETEHPEVLLLDMSADDVTVICREMHRLALCCKVVLWVHDIATELAYEAMAAGVHGILRTTLGPELLVRCLRKVHQGEHWFEKGLMDSFLSGRRINLTRREGQLLRLLSQGLKNKEIASCLLITEGTVKVYLSRLFQKVGVKDRFELALYGLKHAAGHEAPAMIWKSERSGRPARPRKPLPDSALTVN